MGMTIDRLSDKLRTAKESASRTNLLSLGAARARYVGNDTPTRMRERQPRLLVMWGKCETLFDPSEPERLLA